MTSTHFFFIPSVFFLGFLIGAASLNALSQKEMGKSGISTRLKIRGSLLASTFGVFTIIFMLTHMTLVSGGAKSLHATLGHQPLFDQHTSSTASEVYTRLESYGEEGRMAYKHFTYSGDVIFPLSLLVLLVVLAYFVKERTSISNALRPILISIPILWFLSDMIENIIIYYLISHYPQKNIFLADHLANVTNIKFTLLLVSIALPATLYAVFQNKRQIVTNS